MKGVNRRLFLFRKGILNFGYWIYLSLPLNVKDVLLQSEIN